MGLLSAMVLALLVMISAVFTFKEVVKLGNKFTTCIMAMWVVSSFVAAMFIIIPEVINDRRIRKASRQALSDKE